jgi:hypothetical protein
VGSGWIQLERPLAYDLRLHWKVGGESGSRFFLASIHLALVTLPVRQAPHPWKLLMPALLLFPALYRCAAPCVPL